MADEDFALRATQESFQVYESIGKKGKPQAGREWTLLATFLKTDSSKDGVEVITLATGSKCIGKGKRLSNGFIVNDSHAEILARRLLLLYFYDQMKKSLTEKESIFKQNLNTGKFDLLEGIQFHLFISHTPCGDASISPKCMQENESIYLLPLERTISKDKHQLDKCTSKDSYPCIEGPDIESATISASVYNVPTKRQRVSKDSCLKRSNSNVQDVTGRNERQLHHSALFSINDSNSKHLNLIDDTEDIDDLVTHDDQIPLKSTGTDINRTGAKCVPSGKQDLHQEGLGYHITNALRTKPGRGDKTLSMSCSDKIMKWCTLGLQGGLLTNLIETPIYLKSVIISKCPFNRQSVSRAFSLRGRKLELLAEKFCHRIPKIYFCPSEEFVHSKSQIEAVWNPQDGVGKTAASGSSILFCKEPRIHEVIVNGMKQGVTKKMQQTCNSTCIIARSSLFTEFKNLGNLLAEKGYPVVKRCKKAATYRDFKLAEPSYRNARQQFFETFHDWMMKPNDHEQFT